MAKKNSSGLTQDEMLDIIMGSDISEAKVEKEKRQKLMIEYSFDDRIYLSDVIIKSSFCLVGLLYNRHVDDAPIIMGKETLNDMEEILKKAKECPIPIYHRDFLASALFEKCSVGDLIPKEFYRPIAEILVEVWQKMSAEWMKSREYRIEQWNQMG